VGKTSPPGEISPASSLGIFPTAHLRKYRWGKINTTCREHAEGAESRHSAPLSPLPQEVDTDEDPVTTSRTRYVTAGRTRGGTRGGSTRAGSSPHTPPCRLPVRVTCPNTRNGEAGRRGNSLPGHPKNPQNSSCCSPVLASPLPAANRGRPTPLFQRLPCSARGRDLNQSP
jgi:hypothetical protein